AALGLYLAPVEPPREGAAADVVHLTAPPSPGLRYGVVGASPRTAPAARQLALELQLAEHVLSLTPFQVVRELELYGGYQARGLEAGARLALEQGVPG